MAFFNATPRLNDHDHEYLSFPPVSILQSSSSNVMLPQARQSKEPSSSTLVAGRKFEKGDSEVIHIRENGNEWAKDVRDNGDSEARDGGEKGISDYDLPRKRQHRLLRNIRHNIFNVYRRLFAICLLLNLVGLAVFLVYCHEPDLPTTLQISTAISANVLVAALCRTEYVVNSMFTLATWVPLRAPFRLRKALAKVYEYGGMHSGAGVAASFWVVAFTIQISRARIHDQTVPISVLVLTCLLLLVLLAIIVSAYPAIRRRQHNYFEVIHRTGAWISIILYWTLTFVITSTLSTAAGTGYGNILVTTPSFWFLVALTLLLILPWLRLRRVPVVSEVLSSHAIRLHFCHTSIGNCQGIRLSTSPLLEWHSFATIPDANPHAFSIVVSHAGDWTRSAITTPRSHYWVRGVPTTGVLRTATLFRCIVIVTTGSGIGPCLSGIVYARLHAHRPLQCRILWSTRDPAKTYGQAIVKETLAADPRAVILNPPKGARPDLVAITWRLVRESGAEAVFVISNPTTTYRVKYGMESRGVAAFGPVFDS